MNRDDEAAFDAFAVGAMPQLRRLAYAWCRDWHRADDLVQAALERVYAGWPRIRRADESSTRESAANIDCLTRPEATRDCSDDVLSDGTRLIAGMTSYRPPANEGIAMWSPQTVAIHPDGRQVWLQVHMAVHAGDPEPRGDGLDEYSGPITLEQMREIVQRLEWAEVPLPE